MVQRIKIGNSIGQQPVATAIRHSYLMSDEGTEHERDDYVAVVT